MIRFERHYDASPADVWSAITDSARLARWLAPATIDPKGEVEIRFDGGDLVTGRVLTWEPTVTLEYEWRFAGEDESVVRFDLSDDGGGTRLVLTHRSLGTDMTVGYTAGWHAYLDRLDDTLSGSEARDWGERVAELIPLYRR